MDARHAMIRRALNRFGTITPAGRHRKLIDCFTVQGNKLIFWFNDDLKSTRVYTRDITEHEKERLHESA